MTTIADPSGDPLLDPSGDPLTIGADTGLDAGHRWSHGGALDTPVTLDAGHLVIHGGTGYFTPPALVAIDVAGAVRGPVASGPRVTIEGIVVPPIVAKVFRLRDPRVPVVTLTQSFNRTWQEQVGDAGSGSLTVMNDDPDLALVRDGDVIRFELHGQAAFSWVVADRTKVAISTSEEHGEATTLSGPGLLAWLMSSMLVYPARVARPATLDVSTAPVPERVIQGAPIEEDRTYSWVSVRGTASFAGFRPVTRLGPMVVLPDDWPVGVHAARIWAPPGDSMTAPEGWCYFRHDFVADAPEVSGFLWSQTNDAMVVWFDGSLVVESEGGPDAGDVQTFGSEISGGVTEQHTIAIAVYHRGTAPTSIALSVWALDADGGYTTQVTSSEPVDDGMGYDRFWKVLPYSSGPPPVTAVDVIHMMQAEIVERRGNPQITLHGTVDADSDGHPWPPIGEITTKIGTDMFAVFQEMAPYAEFWMGHDPFYLYAWVAGTRGERTTVAYHPPTNPHDPWSGNLAGLTHRRVT